MWPGRYRLAGSTSSDVGMYLDGPVADSRKFPVGFKPEPVLCVTANALSLRFKKRRDLWLCQLQSRA
eukprot:2397233-Karenia_brevis.AAC.1